MMKDAEKTVGKMTIKKAQKQHHKPQLPQLFRLLANQAAVQQQFYLLPDKAQPAI